MGVPPFRLPTFLLLKSTHTTKFQILVAMSASTKKVAPELTV